MNIYTLHKAGSFRPPLQSVPEIENVPREKLPRPHISVGTDDKKGNGSTIQTSETRGSDHSSSCGENTTPRNNGTETHTNNLSNNVTQNSRQNPPPKARVSASRIDASGIITDTGAQVVPSDQQKLARRKKVKASAYPSNKYRKNRQHMNLIHIQAKDEFMLFEDNTDLASHITTPSAIRTSPLETDILEFDHDEFAEEQSLFSAITVPKALRKKKNKKKAKSKSREDDNDDELRLAPSYSHNQSEHEEEEQKEEEEEKEENESPKTEPRSRPVSPPNLPIQIETYSQNPNETGSMKKDNEASDPKAMEEENRLSQSSSNSRDEVRNENNEERSHNHNDSEENLQSPDKESSQENSDSHSRESIQQLDAKKIETTASVSQNRKPSAKWRITDKARGQRRQKIETSISTPQRTQQGQSHKSPEIAGVNKYTRSAKIGSSPDAMTFAAGAALYNLDVTANTSIDSTARTSNDGSNNGGSSRENSVRGISNFEEKPRKIPNSRKPKKSYAKWLLPTSYFCPCEAKRNHQETPFR